MITFTGLLHLLKHKVRAHAREKERKKETRTHKRF